MPDWKLVVAVAAGILVAGFVGGLIGRAMPRQSAG